MAVQFRNLVFEGGGVKGIAYVGAMKVLEQKGHLASISRVGGTSAGAINALVTALGFSLPEQLEILSSTRFREFMDDSFAFISDITRLATKYGWYKGDFFRTWIGDLIEQKLGRRDATFNDLKAAQRPDLYVIGTNLSTGYAEVFSRERHGDMALAAAVRISMSIPLFFAAVRHGPRKDVYVDGGVVLNYPIKLFDRGKYLDGDDSSGRTTGYYDRENARFSLSKPGREPYVYNCQSLGLRLDTKEEIGLFRYDEPIKGSSIKHFTDYAKALIRAILLVQENQHLHGDDWHRTLYIDTLDVETTDFDLSDQKKQDLVRSGIDCAMKYFTWFEDPAQSPANRMG
jgi:NTE family protein